jgi:F0F1-type ATP synthase membrane subunit b/b'
LQPGDHEDMATAAQELPQAVDHAVNDLRHSIAALSMQSAAPPPIMTAAQ